MLPGIYFCPASLRRGVEVVEASGVPMKRSVPTIELEADDGDRTDVTTTMAFSLK